MVAENAICVCVFSWQTNVILYVFMVKTISYKKKTRGFALVYDRMRADKSNNDTYLQREKYKTINKLHINKSTNKLLQDERNKDFVKQELLNALDIGNRKTSGDKTEDTN